MQAMGITQWQRRHRNAMATAPETGDELTEQHAAVQVAGALQLENQPTLQKIEKEFIGALDWAALEQQVAQCTACELHVRRSKTVFGAGDRNADWLIIGEAPGEDEDRQGEPFVGRAGQLLTAMLSAAGHKREQVYIANIIKCRPPGDRDPHMAEVRNCQAYLRRQIELLQPKIILALGRVAAHHLLDTDKPLKVLRGQVFTYADTGIPVVVSYHPAYLLRSPHEKRMSWQDMKMARQIVKGTL